MKAAVLKAFGSPLADRDRARSGAGHRRGYRRRRGDRCVVLCRRGFQRRAGYLLELPVVPGCGRHRAGARDRTGRDAACRRRLGLLRSDRALARRRAGARHHPAGLERPQRRRACACSSISATAPFAEQMLVPTENAVPIGAIDPAEAGRWCALGTCLVPYGGLLAAGCRPGETVLVSGATGNFGSAASRWPWRWAPLRDRAGPQRSGAGRSGAPFRPARPTA